MNVSGVTVNTKDGTTPVNLTITFSNALPDTYYVMCDDPTMGPCTYTSKTTTNVTISLNNPTTTLNFCIIR